MTENAWFACTDPDAMLREHSGTITGRKLRLFACACCRRILELLQDKNARLAIEFAEQYADRLRTHQELRGNAWGRTTEVNCVVLWNDWEAASNSAESCSGLVADHEARSHSAIYASWNAALDVAQLNGIAQSASIRAADNSSPSWFITARETARKNEQVFQSHLARDIFGNPFRPVALDPRWQSSTVLDLARTIYDERVPENMPILADALMDAGCDSEAILAHCRNGPHVRGCWVVDLLLGKV